MKPNPRLSLIAGILAAVAAICFLPTTGLAGSGSKAAPPSDEKTPGLSGIELWTINCNRCHTYRGSNEFTAAHWQNIVMHMRVRANIPAAQAREILKFLQQGAGK
jgi:hypothetical protein